MLTLCIDTSYKYLTACLIQNDRILSAYHEECFKKQSEKVFTALDHVFKDAGIDKKSIDSICISKGPGSYTGVRIAMSLAKTVSEVMNVDLYTISTLRLYAGNKDNTMVLMDARANRAYVGIYDKDDIVLNDCVMSLNDINPDGYQVIGDGRLVSKEDADPDTPVGFLNTKHLWEKCDNIAYLTPAYLKESDAYYL